MWSQQWDLSRGQRLVQICLQKQMVLKRWHHCKVTWWVAQLLIENEPQMKCLGISCTEKERLKASRVNKDLYSRLFILLVCDIDFVKQWHKEKSCLAHFSFRILWQRDTRFTKFQREKLDYTPYNPAPAIFAFGRLRQKYHKWKGSLNYKGCSKLAYLTKHCLKKLKPKHKVKNKSNKNSTRKDIF